MTTAILTMAQLRAAGACEAQRELFRARWGAQHLPSSAAWAEYGRVRDAAGAEYERVRDERARLARIASYLNARSTRATTRSN